MPSRADAASANSKPAARHATTKFDGDSLLLPAKHDRKCDADTPIARARSSTHTPWRSIACWISDIAACTASGKCAEFDTMNSTMNSTTGIQPFEAYGHTLYNAKV